VATTTGHRTALGGHRLRVEDQAGGAEPVRWSEYLPDGMLADLLAQPTETQPEHHEFEALERIGGWERIIAWAQARQIQEMASFMRGRRVRERNSCTAI
jgi:hypothetical protein